MTAKVSENTESSWYCTAPDLLWSELPQAVLGAKPSQPEESQLLLPCLTPGTATDSGRKARKAGDYKIFRLPFPQ